MAMAVLCALVSPAAASPLDAARAAVDDSDYLRARAALGQALASGALGPDELAEAYRLTGVVAGALDDAKAATEAFERCLALAPKTELPPGTSPKIARPFAAAQGRAKARAQLRIRAETTADPPAVTIVVASDPLAMIARVRAIAVVDGAPEAAIDRPASESTTIELPAGARIDLRVVALDERGNRLAEVGSAEVPVVIVGRAARPAPDHRPREVARPAEKPTEPPRVPAAPRPLVLRWQLWAGAAIAFGGAATYFAIDTWRASRELDDLIARSPNHSFDEARDVESRGRRSALFTNIGYGAAGALAVTAGVLYLTAPRARTESVSVAPVAGGGAIVFGGSF